MKKLVRATLNQFEYKTLTNQMTKGEVMAPILPAAEELPNPIFLQKSLKYSHWQPLPQAKLRREIRKEIGLPVDRSIREEIAKEPHQSIRGLSENCQGYAQTL